MDLFSQGDENVLVTFDTSTYSSPAELESKLQPIQHSLRTLTEETGFCASVELVTLGDDGKVVRGAWTPVGSGSRSYNGGGGGHGSGTQFKASAPMYTTNSFASLGGSSTTPVVRNAWAGQQPGSVVGPAAFKVSESASWATSSRIGADSLIHFGSPLELLLGLFRRSRDLQCRCPHWPRNNLRHPHLRRPGYKMMRMSQNRGTPMMKMGTKRVDRPMSSVRLQLNSERRVEVW